MPWGAAGAAQKPRLEASRAGTCQGNKLPTW